MRRPEQQACRSSACRDEAEDQSRKRFRPVSQTPTTGCQSASTVRARLTRNRSAAEPPDTRGGSAQARSLPRPTSYDLGEPRSPRSELMASAAGEGDVSRLLTAGGGVPIIDRADAGRALVARKPSEGASPACLPSDRWPSDHQPSDRWPSDHQPPDRQPHDRASSSGDSSRRTGTGLRHTGSAATRPAGGRSAGSQSRFAESDGGRSLTVQSGGTGSGRLPGKRPAGRPRASIRPSWRRCRERSSWPQRRER